MLILTRHTRYLGLHRLPHHIKVNIEVTMCDAVAHAFHTSPRYVRMLVKKFAIVLEQIGSRLADDDEVQDHCLLSTTQKR